MVCIQGCADVNQPQLYQLNSHIDFRGSLTEVFKLSSLSNEIKQINVVESCAQSLRGFHIQTRTQIGKLIYCAKGHILDLALDVRVGSPDFGRLWDFVLKPYYARAVYVPPGFAHAYWCAEDSVIVYGYTGEYEPDNQITIRAESRVYEWPQIKGLLSGMVSIKDRTAPMLEQLAGEIEQAGIIYTRREHE